MTHFIDIQRLHNPKIASAKLNPIIKLKEMREKYIYETKDVVPKRMYKALRHDQEKVHCQTELAGVKNDLVYKHKNNAVTILRMPNEDRET